MSTATTTKEMWSAMVLQGVATLIFGIAAVFWPGITLLTLLYLFSAYLLVVGIIALVRGVTSIGSGGSWALLMVLGLFQIGVGVYLLRHPGVTFATFILLIGFALIVKGIIDMVGTFFESGVTATERVLRFLVGGIALLAGIVVLFQPAASGVAFVWIIGLFAIISGSLELAMAHDVKKSLKN